MSIDLSHEQAVAPSTPGRLEVLSWLAIVALLVVIVPLFVCMPLGVDTAFYDVCARHVLRGGAVERDFVLPQPAGMAWALAGVRLLIGTSSEAVRLADLAVLAGIVWLLVRWLRAMELPRAAQVWAAFALLAFYLTASEWVHCQPDTWMLLPALLALHLRRVQVGELAAPAVSYRQVTWRGFVEGLLWGAGCLVKPFVAVPGLLVWLVSAAMVRRSGPGWARRLAWDAGGLLAGGLLMGALWQGWLLASGSWHAYWQNYAEFGGDYFALSLPLQYRPVRLFGGLPPWGLLHLLALPVAFGALGRAVRSLAGRIEHGSAGPALAATLLAGFYLGWVFQGNFLQFQFDYHMAPGVMLALAAMAGWVGMRYPLQRRSVAFLGFVVFGSIFQPAFAPGRLALWGRCWREGRSVDLRDHLALWPLDPAHGKTVWRDLEEVETFLKERQVTDGDLMCYSLSTVHLHIRLGLKPSTRFIYPSIQEYMFVSHREDIGRELKAGGHRYIVTDLREMAVSLAQLGADPLPSSDGRLTDIPPALANQYPYSEPVVFRAGPYLVHEVRRDEATAGGVGPSHRPSLEPCRLPPP